MKQICVFIISLLAGIQLYAQDIKGRVVDNDGQPIESANTTLPQPQVVTGRVISAEGEAISFANVMLCQKSDSTILSGVATDKDGCFEIILKDSAKCYLRVSFVGYEDRIVEIATTPLSVVLQPLSLGEVTVTADMIKKNASTEVYYVTDSLRKASANAMQLLDKLQGIQIDWVTDAVKIGEYRDVPMMVEGRDVSLEYVRNINPERIRRIEVLRFPKGKYGDAPIVMNIILQHSYMGYDVSAHVKGMLSLKNKHSHSENVGATFTYATKKWNLYGDAEVKNRLYYEAVSYEQIFRNLADCTAAEDYKNPNGSEGLTNMNVSVGMDYKINPEHVISVQTWIDNNKGKDKVAYSDVAQNFLSSSVDNYNATNITVGAYYRGTVKEKLYLSGDVSYNNYDVDENKQYVLHTDINDQKYKGKKNFWRANADACYVWNDKVNSTIGYTFTHKNYANFAIPGNEKLFSSGESRHDTYFNVNVTPAKNMNFVVGSNFLYVGEKNDVISEGNFSWMPLAKAFWRPFKIMSINANYYCDVQHPNLDQLSTIAYQRNAFLWHQGNPELKAMVMHYMQFRVELKNIIQVTYLYKHSSREITPWYYIAGDKTIETLINGDYVHQYIGLNGDYKLPHRIGINFTANYQWHKRRADNQSTWRNGHTWYLDVTATWQANDYLGLMAEYFLRYDKDPLLQGERYGQNEQLALGAQTSLLKNRLSIMLAVTIPTNAISKRVYTEIAIPDYKYVTWNNEKVNNAVVQLSIRYNFGKGKASKSQNTNNSEAEKKIQK